MHEHMIFYSKYALTNNKINSLNNLSLVKYSKINIFLLNQLETKILNNGEKKYSRYNEVVI